MNIEKTIAILEKHVLCCRAQNCCATAEDGLDCPTCPYKETSQQELRDAMDVATAAIQTIQKKQGTTGAILEQPLAIFEKHHVCVDTDATDCQLNCVDCPCGHISNKEVLAALDMALAALRVMEKREGVS